VDAHSDAIDVLPNSHTENCNDEFESNNYINADIISNSMEVADSLTVTQFASLDTSVVQCVKSTASQSFFQYDIVKTGGGATYIVTRALAETPLFILELISPSEIDYHMKVARFINQLSKWQRQQFAEIVGDTFEMAKAILEETTNKVDSKPLRFCIPPCLPMMPLFIDNVYIRGKSSLLQNLP